MCLMNSLVKVFPFFSFYSDTNSLFAIILATNCNHANAYRCSNGRCIASALLNNSVNDCGDNSDEG